MPPRPCAGSRLATPPPLAAWVTASERISASPSTGALEHTSIRGSTMHAPGASMPPPRHPPPPTARLPALLCSALPRKRSRYVRGWGGMTPLALRTRQRLAARRHPARAGGSARISRDLFKSVPAWLILAGGRCLREGPVDAERVRSVRRSPRSGSPRRRGDDEVSPAIGYQCPLGGDGPPSSPTAGSRVLGWRPLVRGAPREGWLIGRLSLTPGPRVVYRRGR